MKIELVGYLARRFLRARWVRGTSVLVFATVLALAILYSLLQSQSLTGEQVADRDLGSYEYYTGVGAAGFPPGSHARERLAESLEGLGEGSANVSLTSSDVNLYESGLNDLRYEEMDWGADPFPGSYVFDEGRMPRKPGEVVLVNVTTDKNQVSGYGGRVTWKVVGVATDRYSDQPTVLAAPGTWSSLPRQLAAKNPLLTATPVVYWSGAPQEPVIEAIDDTYTALGKPGGKGRLQALRNSTTDRDAVLATSEKSWIVQSPLAFLIPGIVLPGGVALLAFAVSQRRIKVRVGHLTGAGVDPATARAGPCLALSLAVLGATAAGLGVGYLLGHGLAYLLAVWRIDPLPPWAPWTGLVGLVLGSALVGCLVGWSRVGRSSRGPGSTTRASRRLRGVRQVAVAVLGCAAVFVAVRMHDSVGAMIFGALLSALLLLFTPEMVRLLARLIPDRKLTAVLAARHLTRDAARASALVAVLATTLGLSTSFLAMFDTMVATAGLRDSPELLPGQVKVATRDTDLEAPPAGVLSVVEKQAPHSSGIRLRYLAEAGGKNPSSLAFPGEIGHFLAPENTDQIEKLLDVRLSAAQRTTLEKGGALVSSAVVQSGPTAKVTLTRGERTKPLGEVPATTLRFPDAGWLAGVEAIVLRGPFLDTLQASPGEVPEAVGALMLTDVPEGTAGKVRQALVTRGYDADFVLGYQAPPPAVPPLALTISAVGLAILSAVICLAVLNVLVRSLRDHLALMTALGMSRLWLAKVLAWMFVPLIGLAMALALVMMLPGPVAASLFLPHYRLSIPWMQMATLLAAIAGGCVLAVAASVRSLTAGERDQLGD